MHEFIERPYQGEDDFWRIRNFLRDVFVLNDWREFSWPVIRWDYWRWHGIMNLNDGVLERDVFIWETGVDDIAAVLNRENAGHAFLHMHPRYKCKALEEQVIIRAEESLKVPSRRGGRALWVWCDSMDIQRQEILKTRDY